VDAPTKKRPVPSSAAADAERRKIGKVVHDDRGNASVRWDDAPAEYQRPKLEVLNEGGATPRSEQGCNPYAQRGAGTTLRSAPVAPGSRTRTDLRRLSEHIKRMRELEALKRDDQG
jgi:hypothetical protein